MKRSVGVAACAAALPAGLSGPALAASAPATPRVTDCNGEWRPVNDIIGEWTSPWFGSTPSVEGPRSIRFRALSGQVMTHDVPAPGGCRAENAKFATAAQYNIKSCLTEIACAETGWQNYPGNVPDYDHRWPNKVVGWDPNANMWIAFADL
ncbi:hypothetical protein [Sciscionella marina]|uniref:hypothetical protein n=1 Tax=Sciscionella marina TaxID=508770 RepID=UPI00036BB1FE|nr:hypothetical protein [Sciscionella marina]